MSKTHSNNEGNLGGEKMQGDMLPKYFDKHIHQDNIDISPTNGRDKDIPDDKKRVFDDQGILHPPCVWYDEETEIWRVEEGWQRTKLVLRRYTYVPCETFNNHDEARQFTEGLETRSSHTRYSKTNRYSNAVRKTMEKFGCTESEAIEREEEFLPDLTTQQIRQYLRASELPDVVKELLREDGDKRDDSVESLNNYLPEGEEKDFYDSDFAFSLGKAYILRTKTKGEFVNKGVEAHRIKSIAAVICSVNSKSDCKRIIESSVRNPEKAVLDVKDEIMSPSVNRSGLVLEGSISFNDMSDSKIDAVEDWVEATDELKLKDFVLESVEEKSMRHRADMNGEYIMSGVLSGDVFDSFVDYTEDKQIEPEFSEKRLIKRGLTSERYLSQSQLGDWADENVENTSAAELSQSCSPAEFKEEIEDGIERAIYNSSFDTRKDVIEFAVRKTLREARWI